RKKTLHFSRAPLPSGHSAATTTSVQREPSQSGYAPRLRGGQRRDVQAEEEIQYTTEVPSPDRLWKTMQSDQNLMEIIRQERRSKSVVERVVFPEQVPLSKVAYAGRRWEPITERVQPAYVIYKRLLFEQKNAERYGWDIGVLHPLLSTLE